MVQLGCYKLLSEGASTLISAWWKGKLLLMQAARQRASMQHHAERPAARRVLGSAESGLQSMVSITCLGLKRRQQLCHVSPLMAMLPVMAMRGPSLSFTASPNCCPSRSRSMWNWQHSRTAVRHRGRLRGRLRGSPACTYTTQTAALCTNCCPLSGSKASTEVAE
jgi:hypothetical protein